MPERRARVIATYGLQLVLHAACDNEGPGAECPCNDHVPLVQGEVDVAASVVGIQFLFVTVNVRLTAQARTRLKQPFYEVQLHKTIVVAITVYINCNINHCCISCIGHTFTILVIVYTKYSLIYFIIHI